MKTSVEIRRARPDESALLTDIAHTSKRHWGYSDADILRWKPDLTLSDTFIADHPVYVAVADEQPCAVYALSFEGEGAEVEHFWVLPSNMGSGVGRRMFEHALAQAATAGAKTLRIESDPNATGFYERMGAKVVGQVPSTPQGRFLPVLTLPVEQS